MQQSVATLPPPWLPCPPLGRGDAMVGKSLVRENHVMGTGCTRTASKRALLKLLLLLLLKEKEKKNDNDNNSNNNNNNNNNNNDNNKC